MTFTAAHRRTVRIALARACAAMRAEEAAGSLYAPEASHFERTATRASYVMGFLRSLADVEPGDGIGIRDVPKGGAAG